MQLLSSFATIQIVAQSSLALKNFFSSEHDILLNVDLHVNEHNHQSALEIFQCSNVDVLHQIVCIERNNERKRNERKEKKT
jgi:hypothetical protein